MFLRPIRYPDYDEATLKAMANQHWLAVRLEWRAHKNAKGHNAKTCERCKEVASWK